MQAYCTIKTLLDTDDKGFLLHTGLRKATNRLGETGWVEDTDAAQQEWEGKGQVPEAAAVAQAADTTPPPPTAPTAADGGTSVAGCGGGGGGMKVGGVWPPGAAPAADGGGGPAGHKKKGLLYGVKRMVLGPKKDKPKDK
jgi:hypothetical protein